MATINNQTQHLTHSSHLNECAKQEPLFTSLSPEAASTVAGGGSFGFNTRFDFLQRTRVFKVRAGGTIALASGTRSTLLNRKFVATIFNVGTKRTSSQIVDVGRDMTSWKGVRGGFYRVILRDSRDGQFVSGSFGVGYTS